MNEPEAAHEIALRTDHAANMRAIGRLLAMLAGLIVLLGLFAVVVLA